MAAAPLDPAAANLFDIYNDATSTPRNPPGLPGGACNFADLANGLKCGCRRFWPSQQLASPAHGWCMCGHHACYHDPSPSEPPNEQENERPRAGREPLSPMLVAPPAIDFSFADPAPLSFIHDLPGDCNPPASLPDTLAWADLINSPANANPLPPIPSQCLLSSQTASTAPSAQARYLRPFAGRGLQTLGSAAEANPQSSPKGTANTQPGASPVASPRAVTPSQLPAAPGALEGLSSAVDDHARHLDRLEAASFHEDCHDKMDNLDIRVSELESRVDEVEKMANDNASVATARAAREDDVASQSVVSTYASFATRVPSQPDVMVHISSLQAQVKLLQSYLPSPHSAWVVEVVFLPFPLKRLWQEIGQFRSDSTGDADDWTQLPMTISTATRRSQSPLCNEWASPDDDAEWLLPRACSNTSIVDKRLRSRGLVRTVSVKGPDHRSVQAAVHAAFGSVFRELRLLPRAHASDARSVRFLGLHQLWVPLRKVHKDSRLRFLSPAEMMTPGLWDVQFLSSVMMRSSEPRLFITHPDAYLQDAQAYATGLTWQRVRELTRVYPDAAEPTGVPEADALEGHWAWSEQLDEAATARASSSVRPDRQRVSTSPSLARGQSVRSWRSTSPLLARGHSPLMTRSRDAAVPSMIRTASVPVVAPAQPWPPAANRRRMSSHGKGRRPSPVTRLTSQARVLKRRRTPSPGHQQHFTPRWTASPSPMLPGLGDRHAPRGATPFAYATPHSNAPLQEMRLLHGSSAGRLSTLHGSEPGYVLPDADMGGSGSDESYVDGDDDDDDDDDDGLAARGLVLDLQQSHLPEDEPWPGIEDQDGAEDRENVDPRDGGRDDGRSASSSQPSEYPSTGDPWAAQGAADFCIHEDES